MNKREVEDYVVVYKDETTFNSVSQRELRSEDKIQNTAKYLRENSWKLNSKKKLLEKLESRLNQFSNYIKETTGENFDTLSNEDKEEIFSRFRYRYPLERGTSGQFINNRNKHKESLAMGLDLISTTKFDIDRLSYFIEQNIKENKELTENPGVHEDVTIRSSFENDVMKLMKKGYELQGGIAVRHGVLYQALVKYKD